MFEEVGRAFSRVSLGEDRDEDGSSSGFEEVSPVFFRAPPEDDSDEDGLLRVPEKVDNFPGPFFFGILVNANGIVWST